MSTPLYIFLFFPDGLSPLLGIPVTPEVATPRATPPSPWAASTEARPKTSGVLDRETMATDMRKVQFTDSSSKGEEKEEEEEGGGRVIKESLLLDDESIGILDPALLETVTAASSSSSLAISDSFVALVGADVSSSSAFSSHHPRKRLQKQQQERNETDVFKVPLAPPSKPKGTGEVPANLMLPASSLQQCQISALLFDSALSANDASSSLFNQSSFRWEKVAQKEKEDKAWPSADYGKFDELNRVGDSFTTGQFSARSTSIGGSCEEEEEGGREGGRFGTRDEHFSDFSKVFMTGTQTTTGLEEAGRSLGESGLSRASSWGKKGHRDEGEGGLVDFGGMSQSFGSQFQEGEFRDGGDARGVMDAAEKEFLEENKLAIYHEGACSDTTKVDGFSSNSSVNSFSLSRSRAELLSRSGYFMQNTSTLGSLESGADVRPNLGFSRLLSPAKKESLEAIPEAESKNSTYTLSNDGEEEEEGEKGLASQASRFKSLQQQELMDLIAKASPSLNPSYYADCIMKLKGGKSRWDAALPAPPPPPPASSNISQFLPSILETSSGDVTLTEESQAEPDAEAEKEAELREVESVVARLNISPRTPISKADATYVASSSRCKIPVRSPTTDKTKPIDTDDWPRLRSSPSALLAPRSMIPVLAGKQDSSRGKKGYRGQRFSSPIKTPPVREGTGSSQAKRKVMLEAEKENSRKSATKSPTPAEKSRGALKVLQQQNAATHDSHVPANEGGKQKKFVSKSPRLPSSSEQQQSRQFPLDTDRSTMTWLGVGIGRSAEQVVTLRNSTADRVVVNLIIRDSDAFKLGAATAKQVSIDAMSTAAIAVSFLPSSGALALGKLVLKPQGFRSKGRAVKASIALQGQGGCPDIRLGNCGYLVDGKRSLSFGKVQPGRTRLTWEIDLENRGTAPGFYLARGFADGECRQEAGRFIVVTPGNGVIPEGGTARALLEVDLALLEGTDDDRGLYLGSLVLFCGPEACRRVLRSARRLKDSDVPSRFGGAATPGGVPEADFAEVFLGENAGDHFAGVVDKLDAAHFYEKLRREVVELTAEVSGKERSRFSRLTTVEDTLSETRMNCTVAAGTAGQSPFEAISEEETTEKPPPAQPPPPVPPAEGLRHAAKGRAPGPSRSKTVYLEAGETYFPSTRVGRTSFCKVKIKNRTTRRQTLRVSPLSPPFHAKHSQVTVQPMSFLSLPVSYRPTSPGPHRAVLKFASSALEEPIEATLYGKSTLS